MRGRKPTPPYLKLLRGNPGKRPLQPVLAVERPLKPPEPPAFLSSYAAEEWRRLAPELTRLGVLSQLDLGPFGAYCEAYATWRSAAEAFARVSPADPQTSGLLIRGDGGAPVVNPLLRVERNAAKTLVRIGLEFGLTASSRSRVRAGLPPGPAKFDGLIAE